MNKILISTTVLFLLLIMNPVNASGDENHLIRSSLNQFFSVLKSGNLIAIESAIGGAFLEESKTLLRDNKEYSKFLREHYKGAEFQIGKIVQVSEGFAVEVNVMFSNGDRQQFSFSLTKEQKDKGGDGGWKIFRQNRFPPNS